MAGGNERLSLSTDASNSGWGCVVHLPSGDQQLSDYWNTEFTLGIATKEMLAICRAVESFPPSIRDCWVDVQVDSQVLIATFKGQGSRKSRQLTLQRSFIILSWSIMYISNLSTYFRNEIKPTFPQGDWQLRMLNSHLKHRKKCKGFLEVYVDILSI